MYRLMRVFQTSLSMVVGELRSLVFVTLKSIGSKNTAGTISMEADGSGLFMSLQEGDGFTQTAD